MRPGLLGSTSNVFNCLEKRIGELPRFLDVQFSFGVRRHVSIADSIEGNGGNVDIWVHIPSVDVDEARMDLSATRSRVGTRLKDVTMAL